MLFAVMGGVHGNVRVLDTALSRIDSDGIHTVLCTGNIAAGGEEANAVIERLHTRRIICVQGDLDRLVVRAHRKAAPLRKRLSDNIYEAVLRAHETLTSDNLEYLRSLPRQLTLTFEGKSVCLCHGTITSRSNALFADDSLDRFRRQREAANTDVVVCGSDEEAFTRVIDETLFVNPGRLEAGRDAASFLIVNTDNHPPSAEIVRAIQR